MEFRKGKTNPRTIVRQLRQSFLIDDYAGFEIRGFMNNRIHEWQFVKTLRGGRPFVMLKRHEIIEPESGNIIYNDNQRVVPFVQIVQRCLFAIDDQIIDNDKLIITYIQDDGDVKYDCRGQSQKPSPRCYDNLRIPANIISSRVKSALANPYTELGRRRVMRDYRDLSTNYSLGFGK